MEKIIEVFINWQAFLIAFGVFVILGVLRQLGTRRDDNKKVVGGWAESKPFNMFLPVYPYILALTLIFTPGVPLPEKVAGAIITRILYALWCGWLSDKTYEVAKRILEKGFDLKFGADK